jgi:hypothetical protein
MYRVRQPKVCGKCLKVSFTFPGADLPMESCFGTWCAAHPLGGPSGGTWPDGLPRALPYAYQFLSELSPWILVPPYCAFGGAGWMLPPFGTCCEAGAAFTTGCWSGGSQPITAQAITDEGGNLTKIRIAVNAAASNGGIGGSTPFRYPFFYDFTFSPPLPPQHGGYWDIPLTSATAVCSDDTINNFYKYQLNSSETFLEACQMTGTGCATCWIQGIAAAPTLTQYDFTAYVTANASDPNDISFAYNPADMGHKACRSPLNVTLPDWTTFPGVSEAISQGGLAIPSSITLIQENRSPASCARYSLRHSWGSGPGSNQWEVDLDVQAYFVCCPGYDYPGYQGSTSHASPYWAMPGPGIVMYVATTVTKNDMSYVDATAILMGTAQSMWRTASCDTDNGSIQCHGDVSWCGMIQSGFFTRNTSGSGPYGWFNYQKGNGYGMTWTPSSVEKVNPSFVGGAVDAAGCAQGAAQLAAVRTSEEVQAILATPCAFRRVADGACLSPSCHRVGGCQALCEATAAYYQNCPEGVFGNKPAPAAIPPDVQAAADRLGLPSPLPPPLIYFLRRWIQDGKPTRSDDNVQHFADSCNSCTAHDASGDTCQSERCPFRGTPLAILRTIQSYRCPEPNRPTVHDYWA